MSKENKTNIHKMITDNLITEKIKSTNKDRYGQLVMTNCTVSSLFPGMETEVEQFINTKSKLYQISTYGWKYGTYKAINKK